MEGVPEFSPLTDSPYALDPMQAIKLQEYKKAYEEAAKKQAMKQAENKTKNFFRKGCLLYTKNAVTKAKIIVAVKNKKSSFQLFCFKKSIS